MSKLKHTQASPVAHPTPQEPALTHLPHFPFALFRDSRSIAVDPQVLSNTCLYTEVVRVCWLSLRLLIH